MNSQDGFYGPANSGNPGESIVFGLAKAVIQENGSTSKIYSECFPEGDPKQRKPDITLSKKELHFVSRSNLGK